MVGGVGGANGATANVRGIPEHPPTLGVTLIEPEPEPTSTVIELVVPPDT